MGLLKNLFLLGAGAAAGIFAYKNREKIKSMGEEAMKTAKETFDGVNNNGGTAQAENAEDKAASDNT